MAGETYFVYRKSDGLFTHTSTSAVPITDEVYASVANLSPLVVGNVYELEEYSDTVSLCSVIPHSVWKSANTHPFYNAYTVNVNCACLQVLSKNYVRYKYSNDGTLQDKVVNDETYLCWKSDSDSSICYTKLTEYGKLGVNNSNNTITVYTIDNSGVNLISSPATLSTISQSIDANKWIIRNRKEVPYINSDVVSISNENIYGKVSSPSSLSVINYIDTRLGLTSTGQLLCIYAVKKSLLFAGTNNSFDENKYYKFSADSSGVVSVDIQSNKGSDPLYILGSEISLASDFSINGISGERGNLLKNLNNRNNLPSDFLIPIYAPCQNFAQKINNDIQFILAMMNNADNYYTNFSNPITMYIDKRIETFLAEILSNATDTIWTKYY